MKKLILFLTLGTLLFGKIQTIVFVPDAFFDHIPLETSTAWLSILL
jgi:hypothetical protein